MPDLIPISREDFAERSWRRPNSYAFAARSALIPVVVSELSQVVAQFPLCFVENGDTMRLMAVTSVYPDANLFITEEGQWIGNYVPLALRVYPFCLVRYDDSDGRAVCFDDASGLLAGKGEGEPFYGEDGQLAPLVQRSLDLLTQIEQSRVATQAAVEALQAAGLIVPWDLKVQVDGGLRQLTGLFTVNEMALSLLSPEQLAKLRDSGALALAYGQMYSLAQMSTLRGAMQAQKQLRNRAAAEEAAPSPLAVDGGILRFH